jgi:predicted O-methyltransferase YrrM
MRTILLTALAASVLSATVLAAEDAPPEGFKALFNGKDFTGWQAKRGKPEPEAERAKWLEHWKAEGGIVRFDGQGPNLWTSKTFKDFVLMLDWRFPKPGDSGVFIRGNAKSQINIWCNNMGSGEVYGYRTDGKQPEAVRKACTPLKKMDKPVGQWNTFVITMKGDRLTVELNGEVVIRNAQLPGVPPEGEIALQRHGNPIEFRRIYIKSLPGAAGTQAKTDDPVQAVIEAVEKSSVDRRIRLLAPEKARRLAELVRKAKPRLVVEGGTAIGYSALWIGRELKAAGRGKLITMEILPELAREAQANLKKAGLEDYVTVKIGDARKMVKDIKGPIDFVFLDCHPPNYYPCFIGLEDRLRPGAVAVADNAGYGARGMANYTKHVRSKYNSHIEWFDINLPWSKRDAIEVTIIEPPKGKKE